MYRNELIVGVELDLEQATNSVVRHETLQHAGGKLQGTTVGGRHYHRLGSPLIIIEIALSADGQREAGAAARRIIVHFLRVRASRGLPAATATVSRKWRRLDAARSGQARSRRGRG